MNEFFETIQCDNFSDFITKVNNLPCDEGHIWVYRGHQKASWKLKTSLERECERFGISGKEAFRREYNMVREFRRRLHHYETNVPDRDNVDEWMALMQHYGAPTRLLDFTYSPYVAAYFAFERAESGIVAVWAVNIGWIENEFKSKEEFLSLKKDYERYQNYRDSKAFLSLFLSNLDNKFVLPVNPFRLNDRLAYQQGVFLAPATLRKRFMENLHASVSSRDDYRPVKKFTIEVGKQGKIRDKALRTLHSMNINRISLFPGLIGFAESFKVGLMTVHDAHIVMDGGNRMRLEELWQKLAESTSGLDGNEASISGE
jgi:hypothetical protein